MDVRLKVEKPEDIVYTMTITMTAKNWEELRDQLKTAWPSSRLGYAINDLLAQARKVYWPNSKETDE